MKPRNLITVLQHQRDRTVNRFPKRLLIPAATQLLVMRRKTGQMDRPFEFTVISPAYIDNEPPDRFAAGQLPAEFVRVPYVVRGISRAAYPELEDLVGINIDYLLEPKLYLGQWSGGKQLEYDRHEEKATSWTLYLHEKIGEADVYL
jgi:hypothetical protein